MEGKEGRPLLTEGMSPTGNYGGDVTGEHTDTHAATMAGEEAKKKRPQVKKERISQKLPLEKVDEDGAETSAKSKFGCQNLSSMFGVKSYLHHFYETHSYKDPDMYEDEESFRYLLHPPKRRRKRCTSIWWKVFVWIGANFLVFGVIGVLVGYLVPQKALIIDSYNANIKVIDRQAIPYNFNLDVCKLVGLILFCIGGLTLTVALLFPSFLYNYCGDDDRRDGGAFHVSAMDEKPPLSPIDCNIPANSSITNVQPDRKAKEAILTQEGMITYTE